MKVFRMFDIASQTINNSWRNSQRKFTKFYDNLDHICQTTFKVMISFLFHELLMIRERDLNCDIIRQHIKSILFCFVLFLTKNKEPSSDHLNSLKLLCHMMS